MELCDSRLNCEGYNIEQSISIVLDIAKGLKYAHERRVIHGDIKPSNILIKGGKYKISDWGLSKLKRDKSVTPGGFTPNYAAPEQISSEFGKCDERTDIYQLGVVLYELATEKLPFDGEYSDLNNQILNSEPVLPSKFKSDSIHIEHIILKCLKKMKKERYQNVDQLINDLQNYKLEKDTNSRFNKGKIDDETI